jgi:hypothetical protein
MNKKKWKRRCMGFWNSQIIYWQARSHLAIKQDNSHSFKAKLQKFPAQEKQKTNGLTSQYLGYAGNTWHDKKSIFEKKII